MFYVVPRLISPCRLEAKKLMFFSRSLHGKEIHWKLANPLKWEMYPCHLLECNTFSPLVNAVRPWLNIIILCGLSYCLAVLSIICTHTWEKTLSRRQLPDNEGIITTRPVDILTFLAPFPTALRMYNHPSECNVHTSTQFAPISYSWC